MTTYDLYLESGPQRRKTMVHVPALLGCMANGPTTEAALAATPDAIRGYLRFLRSLGEPVAPDAPFAVRIAEHITKGQWLGNGSPYITYGPDLEPISDAELAVLLARFRALRGRLADWAAQQSDAVLDLPAAGGGRTARAVLLHMMAATVGGSLSAALGGASGFSALHGAAERGSVPLVEALRQVPDMAEHRIVAATVEERAAVRDRGTDIRTLRKALRHILEHEWEHHAELARRPGGPAL